MWKRVLLDNRIMYVKCRDAKRNALAGPAVGYAGRCLTRTDPLYEYQAVTYIARYMRTVKSPTSVLEPFLGCGWQAATIQRTLSPRLHVGIEIDTNTAQSAKRSLHGVRVFRGDSYKIWPAFQRRFDWIHADFNTFTYRNMGDTGYVAALPLLFAATMWATFTDSAMYGSKFPRNRQAYAKALNDPGILIDWKRYYLRFGERIRQLYGFQLVMVVSWKCCAAILVFGRAGLAPTGAIRFLKCKIPASFKTLEEH